MDNRHKQKIEGTDRRQFLKGLTVIMGATAVSHVASGNALAVALGYEAKVDSAQQSGVLFSQPQMQMLRDICSVVLPKTDTPSAADLDVHGFIDHQLKTCHSIEHQEYAKQILAQINQKSIERYNMAFIKTTPTQQIELLNGVEQNKYGFNEQDKQIFQGLKSLLVFGYFTTEVGATQVLAYQAVPGGFKGSIPYQSVGKTYGSLAYY